MLTLLERLPPSPACAISAFPSFLLVLVHTLCGGPVGHLPVLCGLLQSSVRCCQGGIGPAGYAVTGQGSQGHAGSLDVVMYLVMCPISSLLSAQPCNHTLPPHYLTYYKCYPSARTCSPLS